MVNKHRYTQSFIDVGSPVGSFSDVVEREKGDALAVPRVEKDVLNPPIFSIVKLRVY